MAVKIFGDDKPAPAVSPRPRAAKRGYEAAAMATPEAAPRTVPSPPRRRSVTPQLGKGGPHPDSVGRGRGATPATPAADAPATPATPPKRPRRESAAPRSAPMAYKRPSKAASPKKKASGVSNTGDTGKMKKRKARSAAWLKRYTGGGVDR